MNVLAVQLLVEGVANRGAGRADLQQTIADCHVLASWVEAQRLAAVSALAAEPAVFVEQEIATAARSSLYEGDKVARRAGAVELMPSLGHALLSGDVTPAHLDVVANGLRRLQPAARTQLAQHAELLALTAAQATVGKFREFVDRQVRQLLHDDGVARFEQQRRAARLTTWTDPVSEMVCGRFQLDPEQGQRLLGRIRNAVEAMFHDRQPDTCPTDSLERQHHLQSLALVAITCEGGSAGLPELSIVSDLETLRNGLHAHSILEVSGGAQLPIETIRRLACEANIIPVVMNGEGVTLDVGRARRLATRAQRLALRAMFPACFVPGCDVPFDRCDVHHLEPFAAGGRTDLQALRPTCDRHHHCLHEGGWRIELDKWTVVITKPDGVTIRAAPPRAP